MPSTKFINLTPHSIHLVGRDGREEIIPASGKVARVSSSREYLTQLNGWDVFTTRLGEVLDLPPKKEGTTYIVSSFVLNAAKNRDDLLAPDTSKEGAVRDENGRIIAVRGFQK